MTTEKENKFIKFFSGKRFYAILAVALIAVGVAGWSAFDSLNNITPNDDDNQSYIDSTPSYNEPIVSEPIAEPDTPADNVVTDEPYSEPADTTPKRPVAESFIMPVKDGEIIKGYDETALQFSATYSDMRIHLGTDIKAAADSPVYAAGDGVVTKIYEDELLGRTIEIDHGNDIIVKYTGLADNLSVKEDYTVKCGDTIGTLSGVPSECGDDMHIHIEVTKNGKTADPVKTLKLN